MISDARSRQGTGASHVRQPQPGALCRANRVGPCRVLGTVCRELLLVGGHRLPHVWVSEVPAGVLALLRASTRMCRQIRGQACSRTKANKHATSQSHHSLVSRVLPVSLHENRDFSLSALQSAKKVGARRQQTDARRRWPQAAAFVRSDHLVDLKRGLRLLILSSSSHYRALRSHPSAANATK